MAEVLTGRQLIDQLSRLPDLDRPVHFLYNYGDHWHTVVAEGVREVGEGTVVYSEYHQKYRVAKEDDDEARSVILLEG